MTPQGGRIAEMHVANICCVKAQRAGMAVARQRPTALPKLPYGGFPICQDRGLHGAKQSYIAIRRRRKRPANSYDDLKQMHFDNFILYIRFCGGGVYSIKNLKLKLRPESAVQQPVEHCC